MKQPSFKTREQDALILEGRKRCSRCQKIKPVDQFCKSSVARNGLSWACRACSNSVEVRYGSHQKIFLKEFRARTLAKSNNVMSEYVRLYQQYPLMKKTCATCGRTFFNIKSNVKYCSKKCQVIMNESTRTRSTEYHRSRRYRYDARIKANGFERFTHKEIFERDKWICGICGGPVEKELSFPHPQCATLDHIVPISKGGGHIKNNVQLAHFY